MTLNFRSFYLYFLNSEFVGTIGVLGTKSRASCMDHSKQSYILSLRTSPFIHKAFKELC